MTLDNICYCMCTTFSAENDTFISTTSTAGNDATVAHSRPLIPQKSKRINYALEKHCIRSLELFKMYTLFRKSHQDEPQDSDGQGFLELAGTPYPPASVLAATSDPSIPLIPLSPLPFVNSC